MLQFSRSLIAALALSSIVLVDVANAAECTDAELQASLDIWAQAAATSACSPYAIGDSMVSAPCSATDCVSVMEQVGEDLPDCTTSGVNNKIDVQNAMTACNGEDLTPTSSPGVTPPTASPLITTAPITTIAPFPGVAPSIGGSSDSTTSFGSSSADSAVTTDTSSSSATPTPTTASSNVSCTDSQVESIETLYARAAKSSSCQADSYISSYSVYIFTKCGSSCASALSILAGDLPDCYATYAATNTKNALQKEIDACTGPYHTTSISTTLYLSSTTSSNASSNMSAQVYQWMALALFAMVGVLM
ncbi:hypothetical protein PHYBOEH_009627 [Phytophthora boehmeriae]|uniref:Elicitin n=1 Tax=Phytophthora boehmeriae TaxID=109152 RepID=A0A8T1VW89_9STRA|nr:hypothetical protein PHYBOEH_009627 [Phytophthora boehmeriae]